MIAIYRWCSSSEGEACWQESATLPDGTAKDLLENEIWWIDLTNPTPEEEDAVFHRFVPIHTLTFEDITKPRREPNQSPHLPKVEEFDDYLFVIINPLRPVVRDAAGHLKAPSRRLFHTQLSAVLAARVLVTHHIEELTSVTEGRQFIARHAHAASRGPDYLFHLVLDALVDDYAPIVDRLSDQLDAIETRMFRRPPKNLLAHLLRLKRWIVGIRKTLILEREVLLRLTRGEFALVDDREIVYYRNVYDHLVRYAELTETAREMISDLLQSYQANLSNRLNAIMKVLAMISTIVLPMSLIAGIYGMNFKTMPELEWEWGYPFAMSLMVLTAVGSLVYFWYKKWI